VTFAKPQAGMIKDRQGWAMRLSKPFADAPPM
jgi:hypothetical protein